MLVRECWPHSHVPDVEQEAALLLTEVLGVRPAPARLLQPVAGVAVRVPALLRPTGGGHREQHQEEEEEPTTNAITVPAQTHRRDRVERVDRQPTLSQS